MPKKFMVSFIVFDRNSNRVDFGTLFIKNCNSEQEAVGTAYLAVRERYDAKHYYNHQVCATEITQEHWE